MEEGRPQLYFAIYEEGGEEKTTDLGARSVDGARIVFAQHFPRGKIQALCLYCKQCGYPTLRHHRSCKAKNH